MITLTYIRGVLCALVLALSTGLSTGCATAPVTVGLSSSAAASIDDQRIKDRHIELIVADLVTAMVQVLELAPLTTTLQVSTPRGVFGEKLVKALETVGYGLQYVSEDQGVNYVSYANRSIVSNSGNVHDFVIRVGSIELTREYDVLDGKVVPTSIMYVKGTRSFDNIVLNQDVFLQQGGQIDFENGVEVELLDATVLASSVSAVSQLDNQRGTALETIAALVDARNSSVGTSEQQLLESKSAYQPVRLAAISFPDASMKLGRKNKSVIKTMQNSLDVGRDALFINSCASGDYPDSAEAASKRATRIKEEFLLYGIPRQLIALEGCIESGYPAAEGSPRTVLVMQRRHENPQLQANNLQNAFPARPLVMTIPYGAGGATDYQARIVTMVASDNNMLGQPISIVNKPGQGGRAGWTWFADTATDTGYDIAAYNVPHFIAQSIKYSTPYNIDTLEPLGNWGADPAVLVVPAGSPFKTLREYLLFARANPGVVSVSGAGLFVGHHIAFLQLEKATGMKLDYRTAKGGAAALEQVVNGEVMSGFNNLSDAFRMGNKVRTLAIADLERHAYMPNVPTFRELAVNIDDSSVNFRGIMVPKGTSQQVIELLSDTVINMFNSPQVSERMREGGSPLKIMTRDEVITMWEERQAYLTELLKGL